MDSTNHGGTSAWFLTFDLQHFLRTIGRLFAGYTLVVPHGEKWLDLFLCAGVAISIFCTCSLSFLRKPFVFLFYTFGTIELLAFTYLRFLGGGPRHYGHFWLIFVAAHWLAIQYQPQDKLFNYINHYFKYKLSYWNKAFTLRQMIFMGILWLQFLAGILYAYPRDLIIPFSAGHETASYLQESGLSERFIVGSRDTSMATISAYLNRQIYYPETEQMGSYTLFNESRHELDHIETLKLLDDQLLDKHPDLLLILHKKLDVDYSGLSLSEIKRFEHSWTDSERYYLYTMKRSST